MLVILPIFFTKVKSATGPKYLSSLTHSDCVPNSHAIRSIKEISTKISNKILSRKKEQLKTKKLPSLRGQGVRAVAVFRYDDVTKVWTVSSDNLYPFIRLKLNNKKKTLNNLIHGHTKIIIFKFTSQEN